MTEPTPMQRIESATQLRANARRNLALRIKLLEDKIYAAKKQALPAIKASAAKFATAHEMLRALIDGNRGQFEKPRTCILHDTKIGLQKGKGRLVYANREATVDLIKKHFPEQVELLISTVETPNAKAIEKLPAKDLKRIGVTIEDATDQIVIKDTDTTIEKLVQTMLKDLCEVSEDEAA